MRKLFFFSAIFVQYKCCGSHLCVRFHGKIMPDSVSTKWHMIIGASNFFKTEIFVHSYNPIIMFINKNLQKDKEAHILLKTWAAACFHLLSIIKFQPKKPSVIDTLHLFMFIKSWKTHVYFLRQFSASIYWSIKYLWSKQFYL